MNKRGQKKNMDYEQDRKGMKDMIMKGLKNQGYECEWTKKSEF
jgi:hypothetical protein